MEDLIYWVWLSQVFNIGSRRPLEILSEFSNPKNFYEKIQNNEKIEFLSTKHIVNARKTSLQRAIMIIERCEKLNIKIINMEDNDYPKRLLNLNNPPTVLYVLGDISDIDNQVAITVVGTRKPSDYGKKVTGNISYELAKAGVTIVSGCAVGVDTYAHMGALKANGKTIGVLGCGLDVDYPKENFDLKMAILKNGALISELPPSTKPNPKIFPIRNRLMAALCLGVVIGEAPLKSGSLITANQGLEMGKDIFCVPPRDIFDPKFAGVTKYINDGAIMVGNSKIIIDEYIDMFPHRLDTTKIKTAYITSPKPSEVEKNYLKVAQPKTNYKTEQKETINQDDIYEKQKQQLEKVKDELTQTQIKLYEVLTFTPKHIEQLARECELPASELLSMLTEFEILGLAQSYAGSCYGLISL